MKITCYSNSETEYFAILTNNNVRLYVGEKLHYEKIAVEEIESVLFTGDSYIYVEKESNILTKVSLYNEEISYHVITEYKEVSLLKYLGDGMTVMRGFKEGKRNGEIFIYDFFMKRTVNVLPFDVSKDDEFYDLMLKDEMIYVYGCFRHRIVDSDYEDTYLLAYEIKKNAGLELKDKLSVVIIYDDFDETSVAVERNKNGDINGMRFPLFDHYLYNWLEGERCLFTQAGNVCFFSKDFEGLIIAEPYTGDVHKLIALPEKNAQANKKYKCIYNEYTGILSIVSVEGVEQYKVCDSISASGNEIEILNQKYNEACEKNINLQKHPSGHLFKRAFYRAIEAVVVEKI